MFFQSTESGITDPREVYMSLQMVFDWKLKLIQSNHSLFSPTTSILVNAWMLASITKSSSPWVTSRQLFRFASTESSENWHEHGPLFGPLLHAHPDCKNCLRFPTTSSPVSITSSPSSIRAILWFPPTTANKGSIEGYTRLVVALPCQLYHM